MPARPLSVHLSLLREWRSVAGHRVAVSAQTAWIDGRAKVTCEKGPKGPTGRFIVYLDGAHAGDFPSFASAIREADRRARAPRA